jgi:diacylglycerol kinase family enzyme
MNKLLLIVNPYCGYGNSIKILEQSVLPKLGSVYYYIAITNDKSECQTYLDNLEAYSGILVLGGDGTVSYVLQYLLYNNISIPIGHIPCGSGNGLMTSLLHSINIDYSLENAISQILTLEPKKIDTMKVELIEQNKTFYSFLFISYGTFSNLDLKTEWLRRIGDFRFTLGAIWELLWKESFSAKLKYKVVGSDMENIAYKIVEGEFLYFVAANLSHASQGAHISPNSLPNDGKIGLSYLKMPSDRYTLYKVLSGLEDGSFIQYLTYVETTEFELTPETGYLDIDGENFNTQAIKVNSISKNMSVYY